MKHLLIIEDDKIDQMAFERFAKTSDFNYTFNLAKSISEAKKLIRQEKFDAIVSDYFLQDGNAFEILEMKIDIPIIVTTGTGSEEIAVQALKMGAYDYLIKDVDGFYLRMLPITVENALHRFNSEKELKEYHLNLEELIKQKTVELKKEIEINKETSEDLLKMNMIFKNSNDVTFMTDLDGIITFVNPKFTKLYGYTADEIVGKTTPRILKSGIKDNMDYKAFWEKLKSKQGISNFNYINKRKDNSLVNIEGSFEPIIDKNDTLVGFLAIQRDVTERFRNQKIQKVLFNISNAVNTTSNLKQLILIIKNELHNVIDTTNFYIALYDQKNDTISLPFFEDEKDNFKAVPAQNSITAYIIQTQKTLYATDQELLRLQQEKHLTIHGHLPKQWLGVPIKIAGEITGVIVVKSYKDQKAFSEEDKDLLVFVSDQIGLSIRNKKTEQDLLLALEKATESDRLKTAFLHNISHEIRTPMNGILGFSNLLKDPDLSGEKQQSFINIITKSGERMLNTLNDLMDMSKLATGQVKLNITPVNINAELEVLYNFFKPEAMEKKLLFNLNLPSTEQIIETDREKVYSTMSNLIKNAIKFTNFGGIDFGYTLKNGFIEFFISDTGIGIPKNRQEAIFERFIQADIHDNHVHEGSGLGLSICKSYIEMLGGTIWVESEENQGADFYFKIPIKSMTKNSLDLLEKEVEIVNTSNSIKKINLLIVEDEEIASIYLSIVMEDYCTNIYRAKNGEEALSILNDHPEIELILMDLKMPKLNGFDAVVKIRETNKDVVIIAQTAFTFPGDKEKAIKCGCNDYISKPIQAVNLINMVKKYFKI